GEEGRWRGRSGGKPADKRGRAADPAHQGQRGQLRLRLRCRPGRAVAGGGRRRHGAEHRCGRRLRRRHPRPARAPGRHALSGAGHAGPVRSHVSEEHAMDNMVSPQARPATRAGGALRRRLVARGCALALLAAVPGLHAQADDARPWLDTTRSFEDRAAALVAQMTLEEKAAQMQNDSPAIERLGLPAYDWWNEALHGVARAGVATVFPQAIGMAASFDIPLMDQVANTI